MPAPFLVFSWNRPFLPAFKALLDARHGGVAGTPGAPGPEVSGGRPSGPVVPLIIAPSTKPWEHLRRLYAEEKKARVLPRFTTFDELITRWHAALDRTCPAEASTLDRVLLLHRAVRALAGAEPGDPDDPFATGVQGAPGLRDWLTDAEESDTGGSAPDDSGADGSGSGEDGRSSSTPLTRMDLDAFFPWGEKLAALVDELLANNVTPEDFPVCDDEVLPAAATALTNLGTLASDYLEGLRSHNLITRGLQLNAVVNGLDQGVPSFVRPGPSRPVYVVGFHTLSTAAAAVLRLLWENGAQICLHTDPAVAGENAPVHWICREHREWITAWEAEALSVDDLGLKIPGEDGPGAPGARTGARGEGAGTKGPKHTYLAGHDLHSQLAELKRDLEALDPDERACVVLPQPATLLPLLHHVPERLRHSLNVATGFPATETPAFQLLRDALALQNNGDEEGNYHWKSLLTLMENPVFAGLEGPKGQSLLPALARYRTALSDSLRYVNPYHDVLLKEQFAGRHDEVEALQELLDLFVTGFAGVETTATLADALLRVCAHFRGRGSALRATSPLDEEVLFRIEHEVVPVLATSLMRDVAVSRGTLLRLFERLCLGVRIHFEPSPGDPETGALGKNPAERRLQVMGVLEATLLSFDTVFFPDATEDVLPGNRRRDPLLPDSLRALLGLPDPNARDLEIGYAVHRLVKSSGRTRFYWQEGVVRSRLFDGKKTRSRFVEECIWEEEKAGGRVFEPGVEPLRVTSATLVPMAPRPRALRLRDAARGALESLLDHSLSPSALDDYMRCPFAFALKRLAGVEELRTVNEGDDPLGVGSFLHEVLEIYHRDHVGDRHEDRRAMADNLVEIFRERLYGPSCKLTRTLPPESLAMLEVLGETKFARYAENFPEDAVPLLLEHDLSASLDVGGRPFRLKGRMDRLDRRDAGLVVVDYKTGRQLHTVSSELWKNTAFFEEAEALVRSATMDARDRERVNALFRELCRRAGSVQLPCYVAMGRKRAALAARDGDPKWPAGEMADAVFVPLAVESREVSFFNKGRSSLKDEELAQAKREAVGRCALLVGVVALHMRNADELLQSPNPRFCASCPYVSLCRS